MFNQKILVQASLFILGLLVGFGLLYSFKSYLPYSERENKVNYTNNNVKPVTTLAANNNPSIKREAFSAAYLLTLKVSLLVIIMHVIMLSHFLHKMKLIFLLYLLLIILLKHPEVRRISVELTKIRHLLILLKSTE